MESTATPNALEDLGVDPMQNLPKTKFSAGILRSVIGENRANRVLESMSMAVIPNLGGSSLTGGKMDKINASKSSGNMGAKFRNQLEQLQKNLKKKVEGPTKDQRGISLYFEDNGNDDSDNSEFDDEFGDNTTAQGKSMMAEEDPSKLIDIELVNLLKFCNELKKKHQNTDEYQEEVMMKSLELGKKNKDKTLILDMDETMIAAKFGGKEPAGFKPNFEMDF